MRLLIHVYLGESQVPGHHTPLFRRRIHVTQIGLEKRTTLSSKTNNASALILSFDIQAIYARPTMFL